MKDKWMKAEYTTEEMKGKVDISWFGHGGIKIHFKDADDKPRSIYIDIWIDNKDAPKELKEQPPNDADLVLISRGQFDASAHAAPLIIFGKREDR